MARPSKVAGRQRQLYELSIVTSAEAEDAVAELLSHTTGCPASTYFDLESRTSTVSAFLSSQNQWTQEHSNQIAEGMDRIRECGLNTGLGRVVFRKVSKAWAESWKRHFKPIQIGNQLLLKPSWSTRKANPKQQVVILDPGLSFGTGQHPTTSFCLQELARHARVSARPGGFLDLGTGSGILAIAAAKLGYDPIRALDYDPESIRVAGENAERNRVSDKLLLRRADITRLSAKARTRYAVVCANVTADILCGAAEVICGRVAPGGVLVLAGILTTEFHKVQSCFAKLGMELLRARIEGEWRSGAFSPQPNAFR